MITKAAIGIGSNQGNRHALLSQASEMLESIWSRPMRRSSIYETEAWGMAEGTPAFLNQVLLFEWEQMPVAERLLDDLLHTERELGRRRRPSSNQGYRFGPLVSRGTRAIIRSPRIASPQNDFTQVCFGAIE